MFVLWNEQLTGWVNVEAIESMNVMPINRAGELDPEGQYAGLFVEQSNGKMSLIALGPTAEKAEAKLHDICQQLGIDADDAEVLVVAGTHVI